MKKDILFMGSLSLVYMQIVFCFLSIQSIQAREVILPAKLINKKLVLSQKMLKETNANYIINKQYDLLDSTIVLPNNSNLLFKDGGCISNGTLVGANSNVIANKEGIIFRDIDICGNWNVTNIYSRWFEFREDPVVNTKNFRSMCMLTDDNHQGSIYVEPGEYLFRLSKELHSCFLLNSNTTLVIDGTVILEGNDLEDYEIVSIRMKENVTVKGNGMIIGDVVTHIGEEGQHGMGVELKEAKNVEIRDLTIKDVWGDCVYIGQWGRKKTSFSDNVRILNVKCINGRRQGLSLIAARNVLIKGCEFINTGKIKYHGPGAGIDIEPNYYRETVVENIVIDSCIFDGNYSQNDLEINNTDSTVSICIKRCTLNGNFNFVYNTYNVIVDSCSVNGVNVDPRAIGNIVIKNTTTKRALPKVDGKLYIYNCKEGNNKTAMLYFGIPVGVILVVFFTYAFAKKHME